MRTAAKIHRKMGEGDPVCRRQSAPAFMIFVMGITASPNIFGHSGPFPVPAARSARGVAKAAQDGYTLGNTSTLAVILSMKVTRAWDAKQHP